jgi:polysaccharide biosynthesis protein PslH
MLNDPPSIVAFTIEPPFPANTGGRIDPWTRFQMFREQGCRLMLVTWTPNGSISEDARAVLREVFSDILVFRNGRDLPSMVRRIRGIHRYSPHLSSREINTAQRDLLLEHVRHFSPTCIWLDGLYGGIEARRLSRTLSLPLYYRSHNVEFLYMRSQARAAGSLRDKIAWMLAASNLEAFELETQLTSTAVFDISQDDIHYWQTRGVKDAVWLPTLFDFEVSTASTPSKSRPYDLCFVGNLRAPNNQRGLRWFIEFVLPNIQASRPATTVAVAGSSPPADFATFLRAVRNVTLLENVPKAASVWESGRVLFNPILSGSGINVKSVEMLHFDSHLVTTSIGVRGLPEIVQAQFAVADDAGAFADAVLRALDNPYHPTSARASARLNFAPSQLRKVIEIMNDQALGPTQLGLRRSNRQYSTI